MLFGKSLSILEDLSQFECSFFSSSSRSNPNLVRFNRDDTQTATLASQLVPGDLVKFGIGDRIPADCRLVAVMIVTFADKSLLLQTSGFSVLIG